MAAQSKQRLDLLVVERGLAESRAKAQSLVLAGQVIVDGHREDKPGVRVRPDAEVSLKGKPLRYVSRGGEKLQKALDAFHLDVRGQCCADIGASTGGFTDCLLQAGAARVHAIDVGYGQLHLKLRTDPRVIVRERVNARYLTESDLPESVDFLVVDVSFISLKQILPAVLARLRPKGILVALIKPQFEVGRGKVGKGGVVKEETARREAIAEIVQFVESRGLKVLGTVPSPIRGPKGNLEELLAAVR